MFCNSFELPIPVVPFNPITRVVPCSAGKLFL